MDNEIPEPINNLIQIGQKKILELKNRNQNEWDLIMAQIENNWREIERLVKEMLPFEVKDYFSISVDPDLEALCKYVVKPQDSITVSNVSQLKELLPEISLIGKEGTINIPNMYVIRVVIKECDGHLKIDFLAQNPNDFRVDEVEQDGSLEVALYYSKVFYDNRFRYSGRVIESG